MANQYEIVDGYNNTGTLAAVDPQPSSIGIMYPRVRYTPGAIYADGDPYTEWEYTSLTRTQFNSLRTAFGLTDTTIFNDVTIRTLDTGNSWTAYNGRIFLVPKNRTRYFWRNVTFRIINLETPS